MTVFNGNPADERSTEANPKIAIEQYPAVEPPPNVKLLIVPAWARNSAIVGAGWTAFVLGMELFVGNIPDPLDVVVFGMTGAAWIILAVLTTLSFVERRRIARAEQKLATWQRARALIQSVVREEISAVHDRINMLQLEMGRQHQNVADGILQYGDERATAACVSMLMETSGEVPTIPMVTGHRLSLVRRRAGDN